MKLSVKELVTILKGELILGDPKLVAIRAATDSRKIEKGDLYFSLKGERSDGHGFARTALKEGACGVVVSNLDWMKGAQNYDSAVIRVKNTFEALQALGSYLRSKFKGPVVGITGSNGKTTTTQMLKSILSVREPGLGTHGNFNTQIGLPLVLSNLNDSHKWIVLEMGASEPGNIQSLCKIGNPKIGILTSLGPAHLETFGSMERIAESKWELMEAVPSKGAVVLPWGEPLLEKYIRKFNKKIIFFGEDPSCEIRSSAVQVGEKIQFRIHVGSESEELILPMSGRFNVANALASAGAAYALGYSANEIKEGLEKFKPPSMRMEVHAHNSGALLINDAYNANPASVLESVRSVIETFPHKKIIVVLGAMLELGNEADKWHFHVGSELGRSKLGHVFLIGKEMEQALAGAVSVGAPKENFEILSSKEELIEKAIPYLAADTAFLFKGSRGVGLEQPLKELQGSMQTKETA